MTTYGDRRLPPEGAGDWEWLVFRQHGVVSRPQALSFMTAKTVRKHLEYGRWRRVHRGVFVTHNGPITAQQRLWVACLAVGGSRPALLGGLTALTSQGLRRFTSDTVHILLPARWRDSDPPIWVRVHRTRYLPGRDVYRTADPPCTHAARAVVDAAQWARSDDEARTIVAASFQQRLVFGDQVHQVLARMPTVRRRGLILRTAGDACEGSETITELDLMTLCRKADLPIPSRQVIRTDASGRKRYLDAFFDEWNLRLEVDGAHHMEVGQWWLDMQRHNDLSVRGEALLRFPAWKVREAPDEVAAVLRKALTAAGWHPSR